MSDGIWVASPPAARPTWANRSAELRANPGKWKRYGPYSPSSVTPGVYDARRTSPDIEWRGAEENGRGYIYGCYQQPSTSDPQDFSIRVIA